MDLLDNVSDLSPPSEERCRLLEELWDRVEVQEAPGSSSMGSGRDREGLSLDVSRPSVVFWTPLRSLLSGICWSPLLGAPPLSCVICSKESAS